MTVEIKAPAFPESVADGVVSAWHKGPGDNVARDELLVEIETDKAGGRSGRAGCTLPASVPTSIRGLSRFRPLRGVIVLDDMVLLKENVLKSRFLEVEKKENNAEVYQVPHILVVRTDPNRGLSAADVESVRDFLEEQKERWEVLFSS